MAEEKTSLLKNVVAAKLGAISSSGSDDESENSSLVQTPWKNPMYYGTSTGHGHGKIVPNDKRITYSWSNLDVFAKNNDQRRHWYHCFSKRKDPFLRKHILKNVNGMAHPGQLLVIMGSSGAGKTTLLNALNFRQSKNITVSGLICVNGIAVTSTCLKSQSAYVQQDDLFIGNLTVKEHLIFQALLRMDRNISYNERMDRVNEVLNELSLTKCQNTRIGTPGRTKGISGGERKRLSFAAEILTNPSILFCDEPTSGLDSFMALNVVQELKSLAQTGKTVLCTLHQPSSELYAMFDKILLMAEGRVAFMGNVEEADIFFKELEAPCPKNYNPADYYIQLLAIVPGKEASCRQATELICDKFEKSELGVKLQIEAASTSEDQMYNDYWTKTQIQKCPYKASWCKQFSALLWRSWLTIKKEPLLVRVKLIQNIMVSLLVGFIYFGQMLNQEGVMNINGVLFLYLINMTFQNVFAVVTVFCSEIPLFLREHQNGMYRTDVYFLSKTIAELPIFLIIPAGSTAISYFMIGLNPDPIRFAITVGIVILVTNAAVSFGYLISCASNTVSMALSVGPPVIVPFLLFGGFYLNVSSIPIYLKWLSYFSWFKYGMEGLMINQWSNVTNIECSPTTPSCLRDGRVILETFNFEESHFMWAIIFLCCQIAFFRIVAYLALLGKTYRAQF